MRSSPRRYAMRRASSGVRSPRSSVTARTRSLRTCSPGRRSARAASTQCSGCRTSSSTSAVEAPSTPRTRSRPTPGAASSAARAEIPQSGRVAETAERLRDPHQPEQALVGVGGVAHDGGEVVELAVGDSGADRQQRAVVDEPDGPVGVGEAEPGQGALGRAGA